jgi:hypothetical protein
LERWNTNERELHARFRELGFELPHSSIKRWSRQELLPKPSIVTSRGVGGERGHAAEWPEATVEQAAAIYAIRNQGYPGRKKRIAPKTVVAIRGFANTFFAWLEEYRTNVNDPQLGDFSNRFFTAIDVKVPSEYVKETDSRNYKGEVWTWRPALYDEAHEALAVRWIATVEKVALGVPLTTPITMRYFFGRPKLKKLDLEENARIPLRYLIGVAITSKMDVVQVIARTFSEPKELARLATEDDALLGVKLLDEGWIKASDAGQQSDLVDKVAASIPPFEERVLAKDGAA